MKRFVATMVIVGMLTTMFAVTASAKCYFVDDFENPPASGNLADIEGWVPYSQAFTGIVSFEDGVLKLTPDGNNIYWTRNYTASPNHVLMFDFMPEAGPNILWRMSLGAGSELTLNDRSNASSFPAGEWYSVMVVVKDCKTIAFYYRKKADVNGAWTLFREKTATGATPADQTKFAFGANVEISQPFNYDNLRAFDEYWFDSKGITLGDATVEEIADITSGGMLTVDYDLYSSYISFNEDNTVADDVDITAITVAFDKNMKMLDFKFEDITLKGGQNSLTGKIEISDNPSDRMYYGNLAESAIYHYLWYEMQPMCDPVVLK